MDGELRSVLIEGRGARRMGTRVRIMSEGQDEDKERWAIQVGIDEMGKAMFKKKGLQISRHVSIAGLRRRIGSRWEARGDVGCADGNVNMAGCWQGYIPEYL